MSKEKLYMVKNDDGKYWDFDSAGFWRRELPGCFATTSKGRAEIVAHDKGGHIVTLIEEPEKVVLTKEQAEIVEEAHIDVYPATYIVCNTGDDEELLMNAYVNGYTVESEKKYYVKVPYAEGWHFQKYSSESKLGARNNWRPFPAKDIDVNMSKELFQFTESEIEHYGLQDCERVELD